MALLLLSGCATTPSALTLLPVTGSSGHFQVHEYAITEQSIDNPTHIEFQQRAQAAVLSQQSKWYFSQSDDQLRSANQAIASSGYHLNHNATPPFSGYALYRNNTLLQRDIAQFWPASLTQDAPGSNYLLTFETLNGGKYAAGLDGIHPWSSQSSTNDMDVVETRPQPGQPLAYAYVNGSEGGTFDTAASSPLNVTSLPNESDIYQWQTPTGQVFSIYSVTGAEHIQYGGHDLAYTYDRVIHGNNGPTDLFNPGSAGQVAWFYALRDGLWYYVEVGFFNE